MGSNNQLGVRSPHLVSEWCTRNGELTPADVAYGSIRKVWWTCASGHSWRASPDDRTSRPRGCPVCSGRIVLPGFNDLATTRPGLVRDWHPGAQRPAPRAAPCGRGGGAMCAGLDGTPKSASERYLVPGVANARRRCRCTGWKRWTWSPPRRNNVGTQPE